MKFWMTGAMLAMALPLGGCLIVSADVSGDWRDDDYPSVFGAEIGARAPTVTIVASSNGCTDKGDFTFDVRTDAPRNVRVGFRRVEEDPCKALMVEGARLTWTFAELGIDPGASVRIANRVKR